MSTEPRNRGFALADLEEILEAAADDLGSLRGARLVVTGGSGFVGSWVLAALAHAEDRMSLSLRVEVVLRDPEKSTRMLLPLPWGSTLRYVRGDVLQPIAIEGTVDGIVHAATPASAVLNETQPMLMVDTIVEGHRHVLDLARRAGGCRLLFTSSGAVYGRQPPEIERLDETFLGGPDITNPKYAYHEAKRLAELMGAVATARGEADVVTGRLFTFLGPGLPLDAHFAAGNFVRDALAGGPVVVHGDGTPFRSYQYPSELVVWLLALLVRGEPGRAYNVGSEEAVDIGTLATTVARLAGPTVGVEVRGTPVEGRVPERYVPSTERIRTELSVPVLVGLEEAIIRTLAHHRRAR